MENISMSFTTTISSWSSSKTAPLRASVEEILIETQTDRDRVRDLFTAISFRGQRFCSGCFQVAAVECMKVLGTMDRHWFDYLPYFRSVHVGSLWDSRAVQNSRKVLKSTFKSPPKTLRISWNTIFIVRMLSKIWKVEFSIFFELWTTLKRQESRYRLNQQMKTIVFELGT